MVAASFYPERSCAPTNNLTRCSFNWGQWASEEECCAPGRAFPEGCTVPEPCWVGAEWFPERRCATTDDLSTCTRGWGTYKTEAEWYVLENYPTNSGRRALLQDICEILLSC